MLLGLTALRHADEEFANPITTPLTSPRCTIGRGRDCDVVLEDPTRRISRLHCIIVRQEGGYVLHVSSQINPVLVNGDVVASGQQHPLQPGDRLTIGEYEFGIVALPEQAASASDPLAMLGQPGPAQPAGSGAPSGLDAIFGAPGSGTAPGPHASASSAKSKELEELLGRPGNAARDPLLEALGGGGVPGTRPAHELTGFGFSSDPLSSLLGRRDHSMPLAKGEEFLRSVISPIDKLLKDPGPGTDPLGLQGNRHGVQSGRGFGGTIGGSDALDHVHDVNLPFVMPGSRDASPQPPVSTGARTSPSIPPASSAPPLPDALFGPSDATPPADPLAGPPSSSRSPETLFGSSSAAPLPDVLFGASSPPSAPGFDPLARQAIPAGPTAPVPDALFGPAPATPDPGTASGFPHGAGTGPAGAAPLPGALNDPFAAMPSALQQPAGPNFPDAPAGASPGGHALSDPLQAAGIAPAHAPAPGAGPLPGGIPPAAGDASPIPATPLDVGPQLPGTDPLGLFSGPSAPVSPAAEPQSLLRTQRLMRPAEGVAPPPAAANAQPAVAAAPASADMRQAVAAFLKGAGMSGIEIPDDQAEAFLEDCGATVRAAVEGLMAMLLARAKVKEELRASDRTMVAARENNPLKLSESVEEALQFVFDPRARTDAFLPPPRAVADACADLQAHELALVAGMRAALLGAVKLFEPSVIEKRLEKEGTRSLLANRKAQLWDCFVAYFAKTLADADDNFDRVFGAAFLRAYGEQVRRLRG